MDAQDKNQKNEKKFIRMFLTFVILLIILYFLVRSLGLIEHKPRIPTGNVDIFDIIFNRDCGNDNKDASDGKCTSSKNECNKNTLQNGSSESNKNSGNSVEKDDSQDDDNDTPSIPEEREGVEVFDKQTEYSQNTPLRIFTHTAYDVVKDKIAPASENSYQFVIRNNNEFNILYALEFDDENKYDINMKYRLKLNGEYVVGNDDNWITYDKLNQYNKKLTAKAYDVYTLDWKWFESSNDTEVGTNISSDYKLEIRINAEEEITSD